MEETYVITTDGIMKKDEASGSVVREISTKEELEDLIERIPYIQTLQAPNSKFRKERYQMALDECDDVEWVKIINSVYLRMKEKRYDEFEVEYADRAKAFLYKEIAIRFEIPFGEVEEFLNKTIQKGLKEF